MGRTGQDKLIIIIHYNIMGDKPIIIISVLRNCNRGPPPLIKYNSMRCGRKLEFQVFATPEKLGKAPPKRCPQRPFIGAPALHPHSQQAASLDEPRAVEHRWSRLIDRSMGQVLYLFSISLAEQDEEAARAVCLESHAARGEYGDCDSVSCVGSHATARCL